MNEGIDTGAEIEPGAAGAPEGAPATTPTTDDVAKMYDELGIKAPVPTGKTKGRPKTAGVRAKDAAKDGAGDSTTRQAGDDGNKGQRKNAPATTKDGNSGDDSDTASTQKRSDNDEVSDESEETDGRVRKDKSRSEEDSQRGGEEDADDGTGGVGEDDGEQDDTSEEGKRPGKSNPEVERRFQKLTSDVRERDEVIEDLQRQLQEVTQQQTQTKIDQEDPQYTIDDFRKVRDEDGNVLELDSNQAELAWRRWKDGYDQRSAERQAEVNRQSAIEEYKQEAQHKLMESSAAAYDTLTGILDGYPELDARSNQFDQEMSDEVMPIIEDMIIYQQGTEPGNENNYQPVIVGMRMNPGKILDVINKIRQSKRTLPLNGVNDNVDTRSNVTVPHSRSSDPTVNAANQLYKELGINKRV